VKVTLFDHNGSDRHVAAYFWTSTDKDEDAFTCPESEVERVLRFGMKAAPVPHATPWGHSRMTVHADGLPMPIAEQWIRHRVQNFSKKSYRYVEAGRPGRYTFEPMNSDVAGRCSLVLARAYAQSWQAYQELRGMGLCNEQARFALAQGLMTRMYASADLRGWINFCVQRNDGHAQLEIRRCAEQVEAILDALYPITMRIWRECGRRVV
jgi:flavin-dependent thymidylate synthase